MVDLDSLAALVKDNCNISDAKYWGNYSMCSLLLWLRGLYKSEKGVMPWEDIEKKAILDWIARREELWAQLEGREFVSLRIAGIEFDPLDAERINVELLPLGILYGAGYGHTLKPLFFLAELYNEDIRNEYSVYITGKEFARDMSFYPAMLQGKTIIIRREAVVNSLWDRFMELRSNKLSVPLAAAFNYYGVAPDEKPSEALHEKITTIADSETESYIYHEIGELREGERIGKKWKDLVMRVVGSRVEFLLRAIKDLLADTSEDGTLNHFIKGHKSGSLAFYAASLRGFRKILFNEVTDLFERFIKWGDWEDIENARRNCYKRMMNYVGMILDLFAKELERESLIKQIELRFPEILK